MAIGNVQNLMVGPIADIPADFPRNYSAGSVSGVQPKLLVRKVGDRYLGGLTEEELWLRYDNCEDLAVQFAVYCRRKAGENPDWTHEYNLERAATGLAQKVKSGVWDITPEEVAWITARIKKILGW